MAVLSRIGGAYRGDRHVAMMAAAASKLLRAYSVQVETLRRLRAGGSQYMRIEHIHIGFRRPSRDWQLSKEGERGRRVTSRRKSKAGTWF
jgi:hypothetical protein